MAYQTRSRDPLLETHMQQALRRRGGELIGFALITVGVAFGLMLGSYSATDPNWLAATSAPAQNMLGNFGAALAGPLILTIGWAAWGLPLLATVWGGRFVLHRGERRLFGRAIFLPIAIAFGAVFAATHVPPGGWTQGFGLGGLFGDEVLGLLMDLNPLSLGLGLTLITLFLAAVTVSLGLYTLGFTLGELRYISRRMWVAIILTYANLVTFLAIAMRLSAKAAMAAKSAFTTAQIARRDRVARRAELASSTQPGAKEAVAPAFARKSLLASLPLIRRKNSEPTPPGGTTSLLQKAESELEKDRVKDRINEAIRAKILEATADQPAYRLQEPVVSDNIFRDVPDVSEARAPRLGGATRDFSDDLDPGERPTEVELALENPIKATPAVSVPAQKAVVRHPVRKSTRTSTKARAEAQPSLSFEEGEAGYEAPPLNLLTSPSTIVRHHLSDEALEENARMLENVLDDYGIKGEIVSVRPGPVVTMYELEPAPGLKASRVIGLADDIARSMSALSARVSTLPGRTVIGIELPNAKRETVLLREILSARDFGDSNQALPLALGKNIAGDSIVTDLAKMPHLLIAGTTGSGKSVAINTMILSLLYKLPPDECRMIMIDPKMLELSVYDGIPHLLSPVVTDPKKAVVALKWVVGEMEERYRKMSKMGVRNIQGYNGRVEEALAKGQDFERTVQTGFDDETGDPVFETETFLPETLPFIVIVVDEMADLMMVAGKEIEACIQRLAQMARASGIHLIMATQRPSVDVITGTIKANFPTRISFQVTSKIDSRTILGEMGAEQLLGMGDMLYMASGGKVTRVHGPFVSDEEVEEIVTHLKSFGAPDYVSGVADGPSEDKGSDIDMVLGLGGNTNSEDALYDSAVAIVLRDRKCSTSYVQRKLAIGYNKAARLVEQMEDQNIVSAANHVGKREILVPEQQ
jgi:DNA segregation ATPase FtsK/SpoIIIE, S-DNA-T family